MCVNNSYSLIIINDMEIYIYFLNLNFLKYDNRFLFYLIKCLHRIQVKISKDEIPEFNNQEKSFLFLIQIVNKH